MFGTGVVDNDVRSLSLNVGREEMVMTGVAVWVWSR